MNCAFVMVKGYFLLYNGIGFIVSHCGRVWFLPSWWGEEEKIGAW